MSSEQGVGTTFTVELPALETTSRVVAIPEAPAKAEFAIDPRHRRRTCSRNVGWKLTALNHKVTLAEGGQQALQKLAVTADFDFVFTDLAMPEMDS